MLRASKIGAVEFSTNTLFIREQFVPNTVMGESVKSAVGTDIVYSAIDYTPAITLDSKENGLITEAQRVSLITMWEATNTTYTLTYDNATTETVRFRHEAPPVFTEIWEGACQYLATIPLAKVT